MFSPLLRAVAQLNEPVFLGVVLRSLAASLVAFIGVVMVAAWGVQELVLAPGWPHWLAWLAAILGGAGTLFLSGYLFVPAALLVATLYMDRIADAVDRRFYPGLPPARGAPLQVQLWDGAALGLRVLALQALALVLLVVLPGVGLVLGWVITGWAIGRGLFVGVAMRRMDRPAALALYGARRLTVLAQGAALAAAGVVPVVNLFVPVLGMAAMVHVLNRDMRAAATARLG